MKGVSSKWYRILMVSLQIVQVQIDVVGVNWCCG